MAGESDQTKWVGVRPTDPAEAIPVTETDPVDEVSIIPSDPAQTIPVEEQSPVTGVYTKKAAPAIFDMHAISGFARVWEDKTDVGAPNYNHDIYTVPAGKAFALNFAQGMCFQNTPTNIQFILVSGGVEYPWNVQDYGAAFELKKVLVNLLYDEDEIVRIKWVTTLATTRVMGWMFGYLRDKY